MFVYIGDLAPELATIGKVLRPGGVLVFTTERWEAPPPGAAWRLAHNGRYVHARGHVRTLAEADGFSVLEAGQTTLRTEYGKPVASDLFGLRRSD
ncbi:MAG: hypothetical protein EXQ97_03800 [Alphaproteobacteria bacterium]|nr:hypothetical protein [Alphaproteobacteria bacterium]